MALTKVKKAEKVAQLAKELEGSTSAIVGTFAKLTVAQDYSLRGVVRNAGGRYRVLKNKLAARASQGTGVEAALQGLKGVSSVAYTSGDPVALAKALSAWVKDNAEFTFKLGIVEGKVITVEEVGQLATMPGKEEIYAKLLFLIQSPAQRLATVLNATGRDLAVVLNQGVEKEKFAGKAAPAAAKAEASAVEAAPAPAAATEAPAPAEAESTPVVEAAAPPIEVAPPVEAAPQAESRPDGPSANEQAASEDPVEGKVEAVAETQNPETAAAAPEAPAS
ncbi:LSU ribosomal protein L10p (P0) [Acidisarcina polymorpha]|uniref:Large ribosomal subunit protein uL10 n=1 Tax=Acidisarcina polymorpha TaxID=2211140 RepID=A0A2Z5G1Y5_9BACT|nr:50S ribosomal protein L10 [Acidisarcina polymorpha]AXC13111.1 LSU ribosomal protein L10p (P0) [Acidisarcina polymorpha]